MREVFPEKLAKTTELSAMFAMAYKGINQRECMI